MTAYHYSELHSCTVEGDRGTCYHWPTDPGEPAYVSILEPLKKIAHKHPLLDPPKNIRYDGLSTPDPTTLTPWDLLSGEHTRRGETLVDVLLRIAFGLGVEQGRRVKVAEVRGFAKRIVLRAMRSKDERTRLDAETCAEELGIKRRSQG